MRNCVGAEKYLQRRKRGMRQVAEMMIRFGGEMGRRCGSGTGDGGGVRWMIGKVKNVAVVRATSKLGKKPFLWWVITE